MLSLLLNGQTSAFVIILLAIVVSLSLHEFGHAFAAKLLGDTTAQRQGRLTLNPAAHIDPVGLLMVIFVGFGYARPVPINPRNMRQSWAGAAVAAAGPLMNLLLATFAINLLALGSRLHGFAFSSEVILALAIVAQINLLLMLFNLLPIGPLDGHYIMSWLLPPELGRTYDAVNQRYGSHIFLILIIMSVLGIPIFKFLMAFSADLVPYITFF
jgi:Zn-dependent protease